MTAPLPDRIALAIETHADLWHAYGFLALGKSKITPSGRRRYEEATKQSKVLQDLVAEIVADNAAQLAAGKALYAAAEKLQADLAAAQAKLANLHGWCGQKRAEWTAEARGASSKSVSASCSMAASAFDEVAKKIAELGIAAAEQGCAAVGIDGQRDPDHPCDMFRNGKPSERNTCEGDGHYLCNECGHFRCDPPEQSGQPASGAVPAGGRR